MEMGELRYRGEMQALVTTSARGGVQLVQRGVPAASVDEVIVDVAYAGVCRTDLAVVDGAVAVPHGRVIGHELAGRVVGSGQRVAVVPFVGERWLGIDRDGAFAERVCVPRTALVPLPRGLSLVHGAYVEPVAAALGAIRWIERGQRVLVAGRHRIAELCARVLVAHGARVEREATRGDVEVIVETGGEDLAGLLMQLRRGGMLIAKSRAIRDVPIPMGVVVARELAIRGASHGGFEMAVAWLAERRIVVDDLLAEPRPLAAYEHVLGEARGESRKQLFAIGAE